MGKLPSLTDMLQLLDTFGLCNFSKTQQEDSHTLNFFYL